MILIKAWKLRLTLSTLLIYATLLVLAAAPLPIPGRDYSEVIWPMLSLAVVAVVMINRKVLFDTPFEAVHPKKSLRRAALYFGAVAAVWLIASLASLISEVDPAVAVRNTLFMVGISAIFGPAGMTGSFMILSAFACSTWILGAGAMGGEPAAWAIFLHPAHALGALLISIAVFGLGVFIDCYNRRC